VVSSFSSLTQVVRSNAKNNVKILEKIVSTLKSVQTSQNFSHMRAK
jgi:hypothetical protein